MGLMDWLFKNEEEPKAKEYTPSIKNDFSDLDAVWEHIYKKSGIVDLDKRIIVSSRLQQFANENEIYTSEQLLQKMKSSEEFSQDILNIVTVNETYFFREINELNWLVNHVKSISGNLKILSMPCSTGEEVFSILIMLKEAGVDLNRIHISGYDINSYAVKSAADGFFTERSVHKIDENLKSKYFTKDDKDFHHISESLKSHTSFEKRNIFDLTGERNKFDIVLSRNMFIYFNDEKRAQALDIIANLLKTSGTYIKGHADHIKPHPNLKNIKFGIYQKEL